MFCQLVCLFFVKYWSVPKTRSEGNRVVLVPLLLQILISLSLPLMAEALSPVDLLSEKLRYGSSVSPHCFILKTSRHAAKLKEFYSWQCMPTLDSTINSYISLSRKHSSFHLFLCISKLIVDISILSSSVKPFLKRFRCIFQSISGPRHMIYSMEHLFAGLHR